LKLRFIKPDDIHTSDLGACLGAEMCCIEADVAETLDDDCLVLEARLSATSTEVRERIALFKRSEVPTKEHPCALGKGTYESRERINHSDNTGIWHAVTP
jgi:hypothetical protein